MNETAEDLGAFDTVAGTPSGLDVAGQSSSPYDLALIFRALLDDPATAARADDAAPRRCRRSRAAPPATRSRTRTRCSTTPGNLGGKTGFTDAARHTFVTAAERDGRRLVVSVMDTENVPLRAADQAALLLDWGFALPAGTEGVGTLVEPGEVPLSRRRRDAGAAGAPAGRRRPRRRRARRRDAGRRCCRWRWPAALADRRGDVVGRRRAVRPSASGRGQASGAAPPPPRPGAAASTGGGSPSTRP